MQYRMQFDTVAGPYLFGADKGDGVAEILYAVVVTVEHLAINYQPKRFGA